MLCCAAACLQIQLAAISNVTVAYAFSGITGPWTAAASGALLQAMSAMAGGYDPSLMAVQLTAPDYGVPALQFVASARVPVQDVPVNNMTIGTRRVGGRGNGTSGSSNGTTGGSGSNSSSVSKGRRRLSRRLLQDGREQLLQQQARGGAVRGLTAAVAGAVGPTAPWGPDVNGTAGSSPGWTKVWVTYTRMAPLNVSMLLRALSNTCGGLPIQDEAPTDMTDTSCGNTMRQLLQQSGLSVNLANFSHWMTDQPMVRTGLGREQAVVGAMRCIRRKVAPGPGSDCVDAVLCCIGHAALWGGGCSLPCLTSMCFA